MRATIPIRFSTLLASAALLAACTSVPLEKPEKALATAEHAIMQANQEVTEDTQSVALYEAEKKLAQARGLVNKSNATKEDYTKARRLAEEATVAAHLAQARAEARQAQARKAELEETLESLRESLPREETE
ncbi:MAG: DUF4398 domain-containing protein [Nitrococcus sp.]|nr:DUF4398 domain-containing protein [Nitrococcus sp.]